jgi:hypothetical protein
MARAQATRHRGRRRRSYLLPVVTALAGAAFAALLLAAATREPLPRVGDHWHAAYRVVLCGETLPPFPPGPGNVHTHGDGVIHIHPAVSSEAGRNANLVRFFGSAGVDFAADRIVLPDGRAFRNGDRCPDGTPGRIRLLVNGRPLDEIERYVPKDGDEVVVEFR